MYAVRDAMSSRKAPTVQQLRDKHTYNVCPCPPDEGVKKCPPPTRGGAFGTQEKPNKLQSNHHGDTQDSDSDGDACLKARPLPEQIKVLQHRYSQVTRAPKKITYALGIGAAPMACASCPQSMRHSGGYSPYAADVPLIVLKSAGATPILDGLGTRPFMLMYSQPAVVDLPFVISDKQKSVFHK